jgi:hypothetical protein
MICQFAPIKWTYSSEGMEMTIRSRVSQDRRDTSRVMARLDCQFTFAEASYKAVIVDLSLKGAYLSAKVLPPDNSTIFIALNHPATKKEITFSGTVMRGISVMSEQGKMGRFGIRFGTIPLDLIELINSLSP